MSQKLSAVPPGTDGSVPPFNFVAVPPGTDGSVPPGNFVAVPPGTDGSVPPGIFEGFRREGATFASASAVSSRLLLSGREQK